jgi:hypothetical protein
MRLDQQLELRNNMKRTISIIVAIIVMGCSPERRLGNLLKKYPHLLDSDSALVADTIITRERHFSTSIHDSLLFNSSKYNPIIKDSNGIITKVYRHYNNTVIESTAKRDTIINKHYNISNYYTIESAESKAIRREELKANRWKNISLGAFASLLIVALIAIAARKGFGK